MFFQNVLFYYYLTLYLRGDIMAKAGMKRLGNWHGTEKDKKENNRPVPEIQKKSKKSN